MIVMKNVKILVYINKQTHQDCIVILTKITLANEVRKMFLLLMKQ